MKYAVNEQGVAALKRMATVLSNVGEHICDAIGIVKDVADEHDGMLGPHKSSLDDVIENIQVTLQKSTASIEAISELLEEIAEGYQEIIDDNGFAGLAGGVQSAAGGNHGGGMSSKASGAGVEENKSNTSTDKKIFTDNPYDEAGNLKSNIKYQAGEFEYNYETDDRGRISNWNTDNLRLTERENRLNYNSDAPGKLEGDHAGHLAGDRFGGSPELDNIVAQSKNVNLSEYKKIENLWANAINDEKEVTVNVDIKYNGDSLRPIEFIVEYTIDGDFFGQNILN